RIFEWFRDGVLVADDEVALTYAVTTTGYQPLSEPLVNIRATLGRAVPDLLTAAEYEQLVGHAKAAYYADRSFERLFSAAAMMEWPTERRAALERFVGDHRTDQKRLDAITALRAVAETTPAARVVPPIAAAPSFLWKRERVTAEGHAWAASTADVESIAAHLH